MMRKLWYYFMVDLGCFQPDRNQIVGRLVQIQDYIKQATSMMETLQKSGDSVSHTQGLLCVV